MSVRDSVTTGNLAAALAAHDDRLSNCVHCGFCLPACPTYVRLSDEADSPRGRLHLMRAVAEGRLDPGSDAFQEHIDRCLGCRACETVCPSGVEYGYLLERAREVAGHARGLPIGTRALLAMVRRPGILAVSMALARALRWTGVPSLLARILPSSPPFRSVRLGAAMLAASGPWKPPRMGLEFADGESAGREPAGREPGRPGPSGKGRVAILEGCIQKHLFRRVNDATTRVLAANGYDVVGVAGQGCCGALHAHAGRLEEARAMAKGNIRAFRAIEPDWIVVNSAGCGATMKDYAHLTEDSDAEWFAARVRDVSELLGTETLADASAPGAATRGLRVAYDPPCHLLHGQRVSSPPLEMLRGIRGVEVVQVPRGDECCGGAGIYAITHAELGDRIGSDKVEAVLETDARVLATGNPGCAMQIGSHLRMRGADVQVAHPVEILDTQYRRAGLYGAGSKDRID